MALSTAQVNKAISSFGLTVVKHNSNIFHLVDAAGNVKASVTATSLSKLSRAEWQVRAQDAVAVKTSFRHTNPAVCRPRGQMSAARQALAQAKGDTEKAIALCLTYFREIGPRSKSWETNQVAYVKGYLNGVA